MEGESCTVLSLRLMHKLAMSHMKIKIAVPRNTYKALLPESAPGPRQIQVVAMFLLV